MQRRICELLSKAAGSGPSRTSERALHSVFFRRPDRFLESNDKPGHVSGVRLEKTILKGTLLHLSICLEFSCNHQSNKLFEYKYSYEMINSL